MSRLLSALALLAVATASVQAQTTLFNSNGFEAGSGYVLGDLNGQNGWIVDTPPGTFAVQNSVVAGGTQAVQVTQGSPATTNWIFPLLGFTPGPTDGVRIQVDLARTIGTTASFGYDIDVYNAAVSRTLRFGLLNNAGVIQPFVTSRFLSGNFDPTGAVTNVIVGGAVPANTFVNFDAVLNYSTQSFRLKLNGVDVGFNMPFADLTATDISDADFQISTTANANDIGFMDNYIVSVVAIPEPVSMALACCGVAASGLFYWRRRVNRNKQLDQVVRS